MNANASSITFGPPADLRCIRQSPPREPLAAPGILPWARNLLVRLTRPARRDLILCLVMAGSAGTANAQTDGTQRWAFTTLSTAVEGSILSSPSVGPDGTLYVGVEVGSASSLAPSGRVVAVAADGMQKWMFLAPDWVDSTPAVGLDGMIHFGTWDGILFALRPDGTKRWEYAAGSFITSSPAIAPDGTIYVGTGSDLVAMSADGAEQWRFFAGDWIDASPAIGPDGSIYFGSWDSELYALAADGTEKWRFPTAGTITSSPAIAADGTVYIGSRDGYLYAVARDGTFRWSFDTGDPLEASPTLGPNGTVYVPTPGGRLFAINPDGVERWRYPRAAEPALAGLYSSPAVRADGAIVFGSSDNAVIALRSDGTLLWRTTVGDWCDSSPLVAPDRNVYIGCADKKLYSLNGTAEPLTTDWPQFRRNPRRTGWQLFGAMPGTTGRIANLSARTVAGSNASTLIVGFFVGGTSTRSLLIRGIGPTLSTFGVSGVLPDPQLAAYRNATVYGTNEDWGDAPNAASIVATAESVGAFPLPEGSRDAALLIECPPGGHTVQIQDATGATGIALMETYDAGGVPGGRLINLSARGAVSPGAAVLVAGIVVSGSSRAVLVRGVGPTLGTFGVASVLARPHLRVFQGADVVAENGAWSSAVDATAIAAAAARVGAFALPPGSLDTALLLTLPPGPFTAQVAGVDTTSGVALIEIYEIP